MDLQILEIINDRELRVITEKLLSLKEKQLLALIDEFFCIVMYNL